MDIKKLTPKELREYIDKSKPKLGAELIKLNVGGGLMIKNYSYKSPLATYVRSMTISNSILKGRRFSTKTLEDGSYLVIRRKDI